MSKYWDNPPDDFPGASNHVELTGPDQNGNEHVVSLVHDPDAGYPKVGDVGLNRRLEDD